MVLDLCRHIWWRLDHDYTKKPSYDKACSHKIPDVELKWWPRNGCDYSLVPKILIMTLQMNFSPPLGISTWIAVRTIIQASIACHLIFGILRPYAFSQLGCIHITSFCKCNKLNFGQFWCFILFLCFFTTEEL